KRQHFGCGFKDALHIITKKKNNNGWGEDELQIFHQAGKESSPRPHGRSGKGIGPTSMWQGRGHFGNALGKPYVHYGNNTCGDEHSSPSPRGQAQIPSGKMS